VTPEEPAPSPMGASPPPPTNKTGNENAPASHVLTGRLAGRQSATEVTVHASAQARPFRNHVPRLGACRWPRIRPALSVPSPVLPASNSEMSNEEHEHCVHFDHAERGEYAKRTASKSIRERRTPASHARAAKRTIRPARHAAPRNAPKVASNARREVRSGELKGTDARRPGSMRIGAQAAAEKGRSEEGSQRRRRSAGAPRQQNARGSSGAQYRRLPVSVEEVELFRHQHGGAVGKRETRVARRQIGAARCSA